MGNKLIELEKYTPVPHAKHLLSKRDGQKVKIYFLDRFYNNQGGMELSIENTKLFIRELMDEVYGEIKP